MRSLVQKICALSELTAVAVEQTLRGMATEKQVGVGALMLPMRLCLAGVGQGASLFGMVAILGKEETARRVEKACATLG